MNIDTPWDNVELIDIIRWFGKSHHQTEESIQQAIQVLQNNWITSFKQYRQLEPTQRFSVGLPLVLEQELEDLIEKINQSNGSPMQSIEEIINIQISKRSHKISPETILKNIQPTHSEERDTNQCVSHEMGWECKNFCYLYRNNVDKLIVLSSIHKSWSYPESAKLEIFLQTLPPASQVFMINKNQLIPISNKTKIGLAIKPGRIIQIGGVLHKILDNYHFKGVESWLYSLGLHKYTYTFHKNYIDEFLVIPFLRSSDLDHMGISDPEEKRIILTSVKNMQDGGNFDYMSKWLEYLGFGKYSSVFIKNYFEICFLNRLKESHLERIGILPEDRAQIFEIVRQYSEFSSVEATYSWLSDQGFTSDCFQFVRFNIPFYALPMVNYFIINEMGITNHKELLEALKKLKETPAYKVKAMAYWLRDLELERYSLSFAKNLLVNFIEALTILTDTQITRLIDWEDDREKMKSAVHDMKEVQLYFSTTASLLQDLMIDKYSNVFAVHGISIDMLPLLTDAKLEEIGISEKLDRVKILSRIEKMKEELPLTSNQNVLSSCYPSQRNYICNSRN